ncbi:MAG: cob(I)yrinic acid a,c-diamide adenosyltransferase [Sporomusaceae bacterium]|jgi:cob(I)alamin adenosyltransferase|nr:cob(I)yrinic acid a,c-diamide adenosyltransferase [Sporomusaceae bacterium]
MKVYTKTGDQGMTSLLTGERVKKTSRRVKAYGAVDEINSALGLARASAVKPETKEVIFKLQKMLSLVMADLASDPNDAKSRYITGAQVTELENLIDTFDQKLPPLKEFIIPGANLSSAFLDLARTVARRAERQALKLWESENGENSTEPNQVLIVLNRLSDLCFVLSRFES